MSKWKRIRERLKKEHDIDTELDFKKCNPGYWQRSAGALSWQGYMLNQAITIGSQWSMTELLKASKWDIYWPTTIDIEIIPNYS